LDKKAGHDEKEAVLDLRIYLRRRNNLLAVIPIMP
jgi:hypothetical protein